MSPHLWLPLAILAIHPTPGALEDSAFTPTQEEPEDLDCGRPTPSARIVGGSDSQPGAWPWQVSLHHGGGHVCGGSLIAPSWILSAAHCFVTNGSLEPAAEWTAVLGVHSQDGPLEGAHVRAVAAILVPPNYSKVELGDDLALLRLASPARLGPVVRPVCLPRASHRFAHGTACWATGWGDVQEADPLPLPWVLQEVELRLLGEAACQCLFSRRGPFNLTLQLLPGMLCAGYPEGRRDTCQARARAERVARLVPHENASWDDAADLALLQLRAPVNLSAVPRAVCLPHPEHYFLPGSRCRLARWGRGGPALGPDTQLEAELLSGWWCHCLYSRQGASVPLPGDPPHALCPAYQEEEEAGRCWNDSSWSLLCREEGTWFLAGLRDSFSGCLRPRAFSPLQTHGPWISHVTRGAYLEDQLAWDWGPEGEETVTQTCPPRTVHGACGLRPEAPPSRLLWPWLAEVHVAGDRVCTGILVAPGWVLAATHCVLRLGSTTVPYIEVYLGRAGASPLPHSHPVSRSVISIRLPRHLGLRPPLALLELSSRVEPSPSALPICLHPRGVPPGSSCWVLGWKDLQDRVPVAATVSILTPQLCHCLYQGILPPGTLCVLYAQGEEDRCEVASAPPLLCQTEGGSWVLMGMAVRGSSELFAAIGPEEAWISQTVGEAHILPHSGAPYWSPGGSNLCPPDMAGASGSAPAAALFLLLLPPLIQG
ncbi:PREDICTED: polyserase-2 [Dipodomys ordii]|uniref:Polyserase-2 n=1 Tax=Dipodomys ordii TaxID=10020 RepID=A0A1S3ERQ8_DIPOR|nr:PREDICTED: polyserase-2 [Dipodomys ordii]